MMKSFLLGLNSKQFCLWFEIVKDLTNYISFQFLGCCFHKTSSSSQLVFLKVNFVVE
jgi:hypothetical protein